MRETSLLPLHHRQVAYHLSEEAILHQVVHELVHLQLEDPGDQIGPILGCFPGAEEFGDLRPLRITGEGDEVVRFPEFATYCHRVLELGIIPPLAPDE